MLGVIRLRLKFSSSIVQQFGLVRLNTDVNTRVIMRNILKTCKKVATRLLSKRCQDSGCVPTVVTSLKQVVITLLQG